MATQTKNATGPARKLGELYLDATERTLANVVDVQERLAEATPVAPLAKLVNAQARVTRGLSDSYVTAGRELLA
jgi:hypothetical protein